jgi:hypothetical protein
MHKGRFPDRISFMIFSGSFTVDLLETVEAKVLFTNGTVVSGSSLFTLLADQHSFVSFGWF